MPEETSPGDDKVESLPGTRPANAWPSYLVGGVALALTSGDVVAHHFALEWVDLAGFLTSSVSFAFHRILEVSVQFQGAELSVKQQLERTRRVARTALESRGAEKDATLSQLDELQQLQSVIQRADVSDDYTIEAVLRFINSRLEDLAGWVAEEDEDVRAALWWWSTDAGGLRIVAAPRITDAKTLAHVFRPGEGILGRVYLEPRVWNVADAPSLTEWVRVANAPPRYRGLLCLPIELGGVAGVLTVDRSRPAAFDDDSVDFAKQTARLIALAIGTPRAQSAFRSVNALPERPGTDRPPAGPPVTPSSEAPGPDASGELPH